MPEFRAPSRGLMRSCVQSAPAERARCISLCDKITAHFFSRKCGAAAQTFVARPARKKTQKCKCCFARIESEFPTYTRDHR